MQRRIVTWAVFAILFGTPPVMGCQGYRPLRRDLSDGEFVVLVRVVAVAPEADGTYCYLEILDSIRRIPALKNVAQFKIADSLPVGKKYLVIGDYFKGKPDLFRGFPATSELTEYIRGLAELNPKDDVAALRYCVRFIASRDEDVRTDVIGELKAASDAMLQKGATQVPHAALRRIIADQKEEESLRGICAIMLSLRGSLEDARFLHDALNTFAADERRSEAYRELMLAYTVLAPKNGWGYLCAKIHEKDFEGGSFLRRHAMFLTVCEITKRRPTLVSDAQKANALRVFLRMNDLSDLVIHELRRMRIWSEMNEVLSLQDTPVSDTPVHRRAILRYALACPLPRAARFVALQRSLDPDYVAKMEAAMKRE